MPAAENSKDKTPDKYEIESAHRTLMDAEKIKGNKKLMTHVGKHHKEHLKMMSKISSIADLHSAREEMQESDMMKKAEGDTGKKEKKEA